MSTADVVVVVVGLIQAAFLAGAAFAALRAYSLAAQEHREARAEARKAPLRERHADVIREFKELAYQSEKWTTAGDPASARVIAGQQHRLAIGLTFLPPDVFNLVATKELTTCSWQEVTRARIESATSELLRLFAEVEDGQYSIEQVALPSQR
jgi:hypothetical protein